MANMTTKFMLPFPNGSCFACISSQKLLNMMTSSNGDIFRITGHLRGKFTGHRWIPCTKASDAELWVNNGWVNNREAGDLRRYRAHYDVPVIRY